LEVAVGLLTPLLQKVEVLVAAEEIPQIQVALVLLTKATLVEQHQVGVVQEVEVLVQSEQTLRLLMGVMVETELLLL
jgi:hypothetical protein